MGPQGSTLSQLLDTMPSGEGTDLVRKLPLFGLQQLIDLDAINRAVAYP